MSNILGKFHQAMFSGAVVKSVEVMMVIWVVGRVKQECRSQVKRQHNEIVTAGKGSKQKSRNL